MITSKGGSVPRAGSKTAPSLPIRSTAEERARWTAAAASKGKTLSAWVREILDLHAVLASLPAEPLTSAKAIVDAAEHEERWVRAAVEAATEAARVAENETAPEE